MAAQCGHFFVIEKRHRFHDVAARTVDRPFVSRRGCGHLFELHRGRTANAAWHAFSTE
ncbi:MULTISPECIES: hypothetical protein [Burkholderia]|uniref:Uncharacterized protein n=1 Tax=Burkholderia anthina TaxID=179879 RepID=A0A7T6VH12_9BURK|nr:MULTISPECIES: hypothetical protein [Burkholderia]MBY4871322.1 hypothetical protein [Burkholderia anthina]QQK03733.1 hypothetical protein JFN94_06110 [Burkholderia anthina]